MIKSVFCFLFSLFVISAHAQSTLNSSGKSKLINNITYSYSIGEMTLVNTASNNNLVVTQGVLQSTSGSVGLEALKLSENDFKVYPNPTRDILNLESNLESQGKLMITLFDASGRVLISRELGLSTQSLITQFNLQSFASGNYILNVQYTSEDREAFQSYKIQKIN